MGEIHFMDSFFKVFKKFTVILSHCSTLLIDCDIINSLRIMTKPKITKVGKDPPLNGVTKDNFVEFSLPYGWKKIGQRRKNSSHWDFYLISPDNKRFRSNVELKKYLEKNPKVKCDLSVT